MKLKTLKDIELAGKKVLLRVDYNVPQSEEGKILDDTRIVEVMPTLKYLLDKQCKVMIVAHLGRPNGSRENKYSLQPVAEYLSKLIGKDVLLIDDILAKNTKPLIDSLESGDVVVFENIRYYEQEEAGDETFAKAMANLADVYVNDAFGTMHRRHASTYTISKYLPSCIGLLTEKELSAFDRVLNSPARPLVAILGGAKVADKFPLIDNLINKVDTILIGGGMAYTFIKAIGGNVGDSIVSEQHLALALKMLAKAKKKGVEIVLPVDNVAADEFAADAYRKVVASAFIPNNFQGLDIGPKTIKVFKKYIKNAKTIVWNGPMGVYEFKRFCKGTKQIAKAVASSKAYSVIGGGDSAASIAKLKLEKKVSHISTGGGVSLKLLEGQTLPCLEAMRKEKQETTETVKKTSTKKGKNV